MLILHCDYLLSLKKLNLPYLIYVCQYYLFNKQGYLTSQDSYLLYELNAILFSQMNEINRDNPNVSLLEENYQFQKIQKVMEGTLINIEKILQYKALKNTNSSIIYSYIFYYTTKHQFPQYLDGALAGAKYFYKNCIRCLLY